jgi:hypothetical protein
MTDVTPCRIDILGVLPVVEEQAFPAIPARYAWRLVPPWGPQVTPSAIEEPQYRMPDTIMPT